MLKKYVKEDFNKNCFKEIGSNWALVTAGGKDGFNPMTVSWGAMGVLWNKNVVIMFIRPQRYTMEFIDKSEKFTVAFFDGLYKEELTKAGRMTGRGIDKYKEVGLTPIYDVDADIYYPKEASYVFKLRKLYVGQLDKDNFIDKSLIADNYPNNDFHKVIIGEIVQYLTKSEE
ncbi:MAG: flavin reductase [Anaeroplasmataceae bacterium]